MAADEKVIKALLRFGLDAQSIGNVRAGALTVEEALKKIEAQAEKSDTKAARLKRTFDTLDKSGMGLSRLGMGLRDIGDFLGSDILTKTGSLVGGVGQLAGSVNDLYETAQKIHNMGGLGKVLGVGGAIAAGGVAAGASIYDAMIKDGGLLGGQGRADSGTILAQGASNISYNVTMALTGNAEKANVAFRDTAEMYGLVKSKAEVAAETLKRNADEAGNLTFYLLNLEKQLKQTGAASTARGGLGVVGGAISGALSSVVGAAASVSAQNEPAVKAFADWQQANMQAETRYGAARLKIVTSAHADQLAEIAQYQAAEARLKTDFDEGELGRRAEFLRTEGQIEAGEQRTRAAALVAFEQGQTRTLEDYQRQRAQAVESFQRSEQRTLESFQRGETRSLEEFQRSEGRTIEERDRRRLKDLADFARSQAEAETHYYDNRVRRAAAYGLEVQRMEEDHRLQMLRMQQDFTDSLSDLEDQRDAFGLIKAQREYNKQRERAEQDYQTQAGRKNADYAADLADQEAQFKAQRDARQADFETRLSEQNEEFKRQADERQAEFDRQAAQRQSDFEAQAEQRKADWEQARQAQQVEFDRLAAQRQSDFEAQAEQRKAEFERQQGEREAEYQRQAGERQQQFSEQYLARATAHTDQLKQMAAQKDERLLELKGQYDEEKSQREQAFKDRLIELGVNLGAEYETRGQYYTRMANQYQAWLDAMQGATQKAFDPQAIEQMVTASVTPFYAGLNNLTTATSGFFNNILNMFGGSASGANQFPIDITPPGPDVPGTPAQWPIDITPPGFAAGGYLGRGLFNGGERGYEFVLNHDTTRVLEQMAGQRLNQDAVLGMLAQRGEGGQRSATGGQWTLYQNFSFTGSMSDSEKAWYQQEAHDQAVAAFDTVLDRSGLL